MFGVVPKVLWQRTNPCDEKNRIFMAMRCLLIEDGARLILVDNGLGHKYNDKFQNLYGIDHETATLDRSLETAGFNREDITDVILTHLHFDHAGRSTEYNSSTEKHDLVFSNATHWLQKSHLQWALNPNQREKASFFDENIRPLVESSNLRLLDGESELFPGIELKVFNGHTEAQQCPLVTYKGNKILFAADVFPTWGHIPLPYVMGYDVRPLVTMDERTALLPWLVKEDITLFYEHDSETECGKVIQNEKGGYESGARFKLSEI